MSPAHLPARCAATARRLLVVCDFDGTLADLTDDPTRARAEPEALQALVTLATCPDTWVAIVSGRSMRSLRTCFGPVPRLILRGTYGLERSLRSHGPNRKEKNRLRLLTRAFASICRVEPRAWIETKPLSRVLHTRAISARRRRNVQLLASTYLAEIPDIHVMRGKDTLEAICRKASKADAVSELIVDRHPDCVFYFGDDQADEEVFALLRDTRHIAVSQPVMDQLLTFKVGPGRSRALYRLKSPQQVAQLLVRMASMRHKACARVRMLSE